MAATGSHQSGSHLSFGFLIVRGQLLDDRILNGALQSLASADLRIHFQKATKN